MNQFMLVRVREDSMLPTLSDGQWVLVLRGASRIRAGDIAVFVSPADKQLAVKRCVLKGEELPLVDHGWLITPWGKWFLTDFQWNQMTKASRPNKDSLFMVGDNQFQSMDSRSYGYVDRRNFVGRVLIRRFHG